MGKCYSLFIKRATGVVMLCPAVLCCKTQREDGTADMDQVSQSYDCAIKASLSEKTKFGKMHRFQPFFLFVAAGKHSVNKLHMHALLYFMFKILQSNILEFL